MRSQKIRNKKVLLVSNSAVLGEDVILHGINLSTRMDAALEVLHLLKAEAADSAALGFGENTIRLSEAEDIQYIQLLGEGDFDQEVIDYLKERRNVLCVVLYLCGGEYGENKGERQKKLKEVTELLSCPVVLYTGSPVYL